MNIVQTLWTAPIFFETNNNHIQHKQFGGWNEFKYFVFSQAYSCLRLKEYYKSLEFVTDSEGYNLFINKIGLPYTSIHLLPESYNTLNQKLWALPKLYTYSIQKKPFIHIDNDVFIYSKLSKIELSQVCVQSKEFISKDYRIGIDLIINNFDYIPFFFKNHDITQKEVINAGIFGGNDLFFIKEYTDFVFNFLFQNEKKIEQSPSHLIGTINMIFEQLFLTYLAENHDIKISHLINICNKNDYIELRKFEKTPFENKYIHCLGEFKKNFTIAEQIELRLAFEFPNYYQKIIKLINKNNIINTQIFEKFSNAQNIIFKCKNRSEFLKLKLTLYEDVQISNEGDDYYIYTPSSKYKLEGWSFYLLYFHENHMSGIELINIILRSKLKNSFSKKDIQDNIFGLISQHINYYFTLRITN